MKELPVITKYYNINFTVPHGEKGYTQNYYEGVVADCLEDAIAEVRRVFPNATLVGVHHRGTITLSASVLLRASDASVALSPEQNGGSSPAPAA